MAVATITAITAEFTEFTGMVKYGPCRVTVKPPLGPRGFGVPRVPTGLHMGSMGSAGSTGRSALGPWVLGPLCTLRVVLGS